MARYRSVPNRRPVVPAQPAPEPAADLSALLKADLVALATKRGVDASGTKADILARLESAK